ncbi:MAG: hypothetical protein KDE22_16995, partial [Rhodobacterales bacterium]|nr:hypothetical protein [Rhodobacterales bacterium]
FDYILEAVDWVGREGWRFLADYTFDAPSGRWFHGGAPAAEPARLADLCYGTGGLEYHSHRRRAPESDLAGYLDRARALAAESAAHRPEPRPCAALPPETEPLRWFALPTDDPQAPPPVDLIF